MADTAKWLVLLLATLVVGGWIGYMLGYISASRELRPLVDRAQGHAREMSDMVTEYERMVAEQLRALRDA